MFRKFLLFLCFTTMFYNSQLLLAADSSAPAKKEESKKEESRSNAFDQWELETKERSEKEEDRFAELWKKTLIFLAVLVLFVFFATWATKRFSRIRLGFDTKQARIQITDRKLLSNKCCLYIVSIDEQELVIAESPGGVHLLSHLTPNKES
jgi:flagellar biogenesis protein FliO